MKPLPLVPVLDNALLDGASGDGPCKCALLKADRWLQCEARGSIQPGQGAVQSRGEGDFSPVAQRPEQALYKRQVAGSSPARTTNFDHVWFWKSRLPHRKGQPCRVLIRGGKMNSILVQFEDGERVCTSRYAVRKTNL